MQALVRLGANTDVKDDDGKTLPVDAAEWGDVPLVKSLIGCIAEIDAKDSDR